MESIAQKVRRCRKIRLERWTLLFFNKTEKEHPGTRLEVMLGIADFWKNEKGERKNQKKREEQKKVCQFVADVSLMALQLSPQLSGSWELSTPLHP